MFHVLHFKELASTNDYVKEHAQDLQVRDVIWAYRQTRGRGRFARVWQSKEDLTFSIFFPKSSQTHTILAPLAVVYALSSLDIETTIKWPNDILYQGKKCVGILVERIYEGNTPMYEVVGIGVNISGEFSNSIASKAIALPNNLQAESVLYRILRMYEILLRMDTEAVLREYRRYSYLFGKEIEIDHKRYKVEDITMDGELIVQNDREQRRLRSEEITLEQTYDGGE